MSRYSFDDEHGERWWVGYDVAAATFFLDRDRDLDDEGYDPAPMRSVREVQERAHERVTIPPRLLTRLAQEEPVSSLAAEAASIARTDQAAAALSRAPRASYPHAATRATSQKPQQGSRAGRSGPYAPGQGRGFERGE